MTDNGKSDDKDKKKKPWPEDFPFGDLWKVINESLNRWFEGFSGSDAERIDEAFKKFLSSPFVMGWSVSIGPDGIPRIQQFGSKSPESGKGYTLSKDREPLIDVYDLGDMLRVIVEIPGVSKENIQVRTEAKRLRISASQGERGYSKVIDLPAEIIPDSAQANYNFGVLEVTLKKVKSPEDKGSGVNVSIK